MATVTATYDERTPDYPQAADCKCAAGEDLTISLVCLGDDGLALDMTGKTIVLGWDDDADGVGVRSQTAAGDATGLTSFAVSTNETWALRDIGGARFDVWAEWGESRRQLIPQSTLAIQGAVAPPPADVIYYGVGVAGLTSVATLTLSEATSLDLTCTVSPAAQKFYLAWGIDIGTPVVTMSGHSVAMLTATAIHVDGRDFWLAESTDLHTGTDLPFVITEAP
jgi:hypothetical protein